MCRPSSTLYTRQQLQILLDRWQCTEPVPGKGKKVFVCFPAMEIDLVEIERTSLKSDYGKQLWRVTWSSRAGREFEETVQEAHVVAYREFILDQRRRDKLARYEALQLQTGS